MTKLLAGAAPASLDGTMAEADMRERELWLLLRDRQATPERLRIIASDPRWKRSYGIKRALALHPRTPLVIARDLVSQLYWRDLVEVGSQVQIHPRLRRQAEQALSVRVQELTLGERIALARRASRGVLACMVQSRDGAVLKGLLANSRTTELDALRIASGRQSPPEILAHLAAHPRWGLRRAIRLALVDNPRTPLPVALRLLSLLPRPDLRRMAGAPNMHKLVRIAAERRLGSALPPSACMSTAGREHA